tara:strand:- start:913 stop:1203 length:291 start_codon:yes stop_codon:yes gene_type:complete
MKKILIIFLLLPLLSNCTQYTAMVGPGLTFAETGNVLRTSASLSSSLAMNKLNQDYKKELNSEKYCETVHSSELNKIFFETIDNINCYYDPMSIYR